MRYCRQVVTALTCGMGKSVATLAGDDRIVHMELAVDQHLDLRESLERVLIRDELIADPSESAALASHWLQSPNRNLPFCTLKIHKRFLDEVQSNAPYVIGETDNSTQLLFDIDWGGIPFPPPDYPEFKFIDLFAGIGGFRIAMQEQSGQCVFSSEWDASAKKTYELNFGEVPYGDIRNINERNIPDHDVLCAGFPCQPFSLAGVSARNSLNSAHGFACETQGTLFFDIIRIVKKKRPKILFLENVRNLVSHDGGNTFATIQKNIRDLGYSFKHELINASPLVPQKRIRCYMVCIRDTDEEFEFPDISGEPVQLKSILQKRVDARYTISDRLWAGHQRRTARNLKRGTGFTAFCADLKKPANTIVARYGKDGKECLIPQNGKNPRMLTPRECARLQGFPEEFIYSNSRTNAYRQFGNSVAVPVVSKIAEEIVEQLM